MELYWVSGCGGHLGRHLELHLSAPHLECLPKFFQSPMGPLHGSRVKIRGHDCTQNPLIPRTIQLQSYVTFSNYRRSSPSSLLLLLLRVHCSHTRPRFASLGGWLLECYQQFVSRHDTRNKNTATRVQRRKPSERERLPVSTRLQFSVTKLDCTEESHCIGLPIHCNYQLAHNTGFCRISPSILNRFQPNLQAQQCPKTHVSVHFSSFLAPAVSARFFCHFVRTTVQGIPRLPHTSILWLNKRVSCSYCRCPTSKYLHFSIVGVARFEKPQK